jgi:hypothetical protein
MSCGTVVDANSIALFQYERIANAPGVATAAINHIFSVGHVAMDDQNFIREQWHQTAAGSAAGMNLLDWIADRMQENKIRIVSYRKNTQLNKKLSSFQLDLSDRIYVFVAVADGSEMIVTEDIDFHDPKMKKVSAERKAEIKKSKCGPVCKFLLEEYKISILDISEVYSLIP